MAESNDVRQDLLEVLRGRLEEQGFEPKPDYGEGYPPSLSMDGVGQSGLFRIASIGHEVAPLAFGLRMTDVDVHGARLEAQPEGCVALESTARGMRVNIYCMCTRYSHIGINPCLEGKQPLRDLLDGEG